MEWEYWYYIIKINEEVETKATPGALISSPLKKDNNRMEFFDEKAKDFTWSMEVRYAGKLPKDLSKTAKIKELQAMQDRMKKKYPITDEK